MKRLWICMAGVALALIPTAAQETETFRVECRWTEPFTGKAYLSYIDKGLVNLDSVELHNATGCTFERQIPHADIYRVRTRPYRWDVSVLAEPGGRYQIVSDEENRMNVQVEQGEEQLRYDRFRKEIGREAALRTEEVQRHWQEATQQNDTAEIERWMKASEEAFEASEATKRDYIRSIPHTFAGVALASELLLYTYPQLEEVYHTLDTVNYRHTASFQTFMQKYRETEEKWIENRPAPDFVTHDIQGKEVRLSDFKGHYVLLDFWASWCRPCRTKAKELKKRLPELTARGIRICGISMDDKRAAWEKATAEDEIVWTNTCEAKPFRENPIAAAYKVTQLPTLYLIGPDGSIVMQNPTIDDLLNLK